jgi:hypothetical protein
MTRLKLSLAGAGLARQVIHRTWVRAWTGGLSAVHVGNAAEFNAAFGGIPAGRDHYSCLAAFASPRPALVVLPLPVPEWWVRHLPESPAGNPWLARTF